MGQTHGRAQGAAYRSAPRTREPCTRPRTAGENAVPVPHPVKCRTPRPSWTMRRGKQVDRRVAASAHVPVRSPALSGRGGGARRRGHARLGPVAARRLPGTGAVPAPAGCPRPPWWTARCWAPPCCCIRSTNGCRRCCAGPPPPSVPEPCAGRPPSEATSSAAPCAVCCPRRWSWTRGRPSWTTTAPTRPNWRRWWPNAPCCWRSAGAARSPAPTTRRPATWAARRPWWSPPPCTPKGPAGGGCSPPYGTAARSSAAASPRRRTRTGCSVPWRARRRAA